jgi:hypothetical protein
VRRLIAYFLNDSCRHSALIDVSNYGDDVEVPSFAADADAELERGGGDARQLGSEPSLGEVNGPL